MYKKLKDFLEKDMRMSHIYQPVMIKTLLKHGGSAEISRIYKIFSLMIQVKKNTMS